MNNKPIILFDRVSKTFTTHSCKNHTIKEWIVNRHKYDKIEKSKVLNQVSFSVMRGESFGIIGSNGSGKSTILRILSRIIIEDEGQVVIGDKTSSLVERILHHPCQSRKIGGRIGEMRRPVAVMGHGDSKRLS